MSRDLHVVFLVVRLVVRMRSGLNLMIILISLLHGCVSVPYRAMAR